jgi:hypothetical protein
MAIEGASPVTKRYSEEDEPDEEALLAAETASRPARPRSQSLRDFTFPQRVIAIPHSIDAPENSKHENMTVLSGVALVASPLSWSVKLPLTRQSQVGAMIGSGIFAAPGIVLASVNASGTALFVWLGAGLLAGGGWFLTQRCPCLTRFRRSIKSCGVGDSYPTEWRTSGVSAWPSRLSLAFEDLPQLPAVFLWSLSRLPVFLDVHHGSTSERFV